MENSASRRALTRCRPNCRPIDIHIQLYETKDLGDQVLFFRGTDLCRGTAPASTSG